MTRDRFAAARQKQQRILQRASRASDYSPQDFERDVTALLEEMFPFSVLSGIRLFSSEPRGRIAYGFEMDNLLHFRISEIDYVVLVDAKKQVVRGEGGSWIVIYDNEKKCAKEQLNNHIETLWEYLQPITKSTELRFIGIVVSSDSRTGQRDAHGYHNAKLHLCNFTQLTDFLSKEFGLGQSGRTRTEVLRVSQSHFLDLLRMSLPVPQLGHPEIASAMRYVERCRRTLDESLFVYFDPKPRRWVINGSAGMGKSVLLAYTAAVLSSGYELYRSLGEVAAKKAQELLEKIGFESDPNRGDIAIVAMSSKQLESLRGWFADFLKKFQAGDMEVAIRFRQPEFILCRSGEPVFPAGRRWSAILVDETHDLPPYAAQQIASIYSEQHPYLVVACDRHQKLQLAGSDAKILQGIDFRNRSTRLSQIYRNPAPVYIASLALMFRWFGDNDGPKIEPTLRQIQSEFGFEVRQLPGGNVEATLRSDAHPANSWCHTVACFPEVAAVYALLEREKLDQRDVLWVRFSEEDPEFDYERILNRWMYHNCRTPDARKISDKYIKGQDYPVVVIEGFPSFMDRWQDSAEPSDAAETKMWRFRRELYLCASRATTFLYFVCNVPETPEVLRIQREIEQLIAAVSLPEDRLTSATRSWTFTIRHSKHPRGLDVFTETTESAITPGAPRELPEERGTTPDRRTLRTLADRPSDSRVGTIPRDGLRGTQETKKQADLRAPQKRRQRAGPDVSNRPTLRLRANATVRDLAGSFGMKPHQLIAELMQYNIFRDANQTVEPHLAQMLCAKKGFRLIVEPQEDTSTG
jgi:hypothetical protein